jgi:hypothetical protein
VRLSSPAFVETSSGAVGRAIKAILLALASQDWLLLGYLLFLMARVCAHDSPQKAPALICLGLDFVVFVLALVFVRGRLLGGRPASVLYRLALFVPVLGSFLQLHYILPAASGPAVDAELHALDLRVFGFEPAASWDRFVSPATTEWFAFFYYGYFFLIALHVFPFLFFGYRRDGRLLTMFGLGFLWVYCAGHTIYTFVPAYGPYHHLSFSSTLSGSFWWPLVKSAVSSVNESVRTDVFPSLHTAVPTYLAMFSFKNRRLFPFRYTWLPLSLFATQIIAATMFLRWHYLIDIAAGITLAASSLLATRLGLLWDDARVAAGGGSVWPTLLRSADPRDAAGCA